MTQKPSKKKRIVSFDLDMTLLDHKTWKIPDSAMKALELLRKDSVIAIGSGRNMDHDMSVVYRDMIMPDAVIHMNGTRVVAEGNVLFEHLMDKERLRALLEYGDAHGISPGRQPGGKGLLYPPGGRGPHGPASLGCFGAQFHGWMGIAGYAGEDIGLHRRSGRRQGAGSPFS